MPKLKVLSGQELLTIFADFGFVVANQRGSHAKLKRSLSSDTVQTLTIPLHDELDKGTLKAIYRQAIRYIPQDELRGHFYSE